MASIFYRAVYATLLCVAFLTGCNQTAPNPTAEPLIGAATDAKSPTALADATLRRCSFDEEASPSLMAAASAMLDPAANDQAPKSCPTLLHLTEQDDAAYLFTMVGEPGEDCHGCSALISVHALKKTGDSYSHLATFPDAISTGTWGDPGSIHDVSIDGAPGVAIEHGGTFQGYSYGVVTFVRLSETGPTEISQSPVMCTTSTNDGAKGEDSPEFFSLKSEWVLAEDGRKLLADTVVIENGLERQLTIDWTLEGDRFVLSSDNYPEPLGGESCI